MPEDVIARVEMMAEDKNVNRLILVTAAMETTKATLFHCSVRSLGTKKDQAQISRLVMMMMVTTRPMRSATTTTAMNTLTTDGR